MFYLCRRRPSHRNGVHLIPIPQIKGEREHGGKERLSKLSELVFHDLCADLYDEVKNIFCLNPTLSGSVIAYAGNTGLCQYSLGLNCLKLTFFWVTLNNVDKNNERFFHRKTSFQLSGIFRIFFLSLVKFEKKCYSWISTVENIINC